MLRGAAKLLLLLVVLAVAAVGGGYYRVMEWANEPIAVPAEKIFNFKAGTTLGGLAANLQHEGLITRPSFFHLWVRLSGNYQHFQAGTYRFEGQVTPHQISDALVKGEVYAPIVAQITIVEGFTLKNVTERLAANGIGHIVELQHLVVDKAFLQSLKIPSTSLEGYIYPATYPFHEMPTAMQALETMVKKFWATLPKDYEKNVVAKGLTLNDAVKIASMIELETRLEEEKPLISEVIWRRLKDKIPLAIDAALIYGIPDYAGDLKWAHLSDAKNPYNTRIHPGLPPTPIGAPSLKSLEAVLTPSNFGYYYYVLTPGGTHHHFSKTLAEHNLNVKKLLNGTKKDKSKNEGKTKH